MPRNSFVQMNKLTNVSGRITYISSKAKQENLYATYTTVSEQSFWRELAKYNQESFRQSGTEGKCIEARELIIALPESFVYYEPEYLLRRFTDHFKQNYKVECISALHHNKRKTNYHIHLIFAERQLLDKPIEKIATRNMFYDEKGKHRRTKKEILDEAGNIRKKCKVIKKGEAYERNLFTTKNELFKADGFLDEVKRLYTDLINVCAINEEDKLQVFDRNGMYLATKKIGKNNPKGAEIEADNMERARWNQTVDRALISGVAEEDILGVKREKISEEVKHSIELYGNNPSFLGDIIRLAIKALELLISKVLLAAAKEVKDIKGSGLERAAKYLKDVVGIDGFTADKQWEYITVIRDARNMVVHNGGRIYKEFDKYDKFKIVYREEDHQLYLEYNDIVKMYDAILDFMDRTFRIIP